MEQLTKRQTDLVIAGAIPSFWNFESDQDCQYVATCEEYEDACALIENGVVYGTDLDGEPIDITGYPIRQRPPIRPVY